MVGRLVQGREIQSCLTANFINVLKLEAANARLVIQMYVNVKKPAQEVSYIC